MRYASLTTAALIAGASWIVLRIASGVTGQVGCPGKTPFPCQLKEEPMSDLFGAITTVAGSLHQHAFVDVPGLTAALSVQSFEVRERITCAY